MASITDQVIKLQELTQQNLDILQAINESFFTKKNHLYASIGDNMFAIPSFMSLENKINLLTANFENLINAPASGEAFFNMDGNSRSIEVRSYNAAPAGITLKNVKEFGTEQNNVFKDFVTPKPYINFDVHDVSDDITEVLVKKIIPVHKELISFFENNLSEVDENTKTVVSINSKQLPYKDLYKILSRYELHKDYIEYDTKMSLPVKKSIGNGIYVIEKILDDVVDEHLDNYITMQFRTDVNGDEYINSLKYRLFDDTIERSLKIGDQLVTFEGNAKMEITDIKYASNVITVKVLHGEYLNLTESESNELSKIPSLSKIKFYSPISFNEDKYVRVPLEEDKFIYVAIAPLNSRMNIQSSWGGGLMVDVYSLKNINNEQEGFKSYYDNNVSNIGDTLFEITSIMSNTLTKYSVNEYLDIMEVVPEINTKNLKVIQINSHIENSATVKQIRDSYNQKQEYLTKIEQIQKEIDEIESQLTAVSYEDTSGVRSILTDTLNNLKKQKTDYNTNIYKLLNEISNLANNAEIPLENAKYRIRGYFDYNTLNISPDIKKHIKGIRLQYRYKNASKSYGSAISFDADDTTGKGFIFSDWNNMACFDKERIVDVVDGKYTFKLQDNNDNLNEPSFNQIDIPINQGESVDIRLKVVYDFGAPFIQVSSDWSPIVNMAFPNDFLKNAPILTIIDENNRDIEENRFTNILREEGISTHISDKLVDQDITFYHKPESISSGFYTAERRVIPLKDKLQELTNAIGKLNEEIHGSNGDSIKVSFKLSTSTYDLIPLQNKNVVTEQYSNFALYKNANLGDYDVDYDGNLVSVTAYINIKNTSQTHSQKLYSLFPGDNSDVLSINSVMPEKLQEALQGYCGMQDYEKVYMYQLNASADLNESLYPQHFNQFIYFRYKDPLNNLYYANRDTNDLSIGTDPSYRNLLSCNTLHIKYNNDRHKGYSKYMFVYPVLQDTSDLSTPNQVSGTYRILNPGEEINIPIVIEFKVAGENDSIRKTISFDIYPSLYKDPVTYKVTIIAKNINEPGDMNNSSTNVIKQYTNTVTQ